MGLYKKEVLIRPASTVSVTAAVTWTMGWMDAFYTAEGNEDNFFADIFDPRGNHPRIIRVFHTGCSLSPYFIPEDQLVFNLIGDKDDPGLDDAYLDEVEGGGESDFILQEDSAFISLSSKVDDLEAEDEKWLTRAEVLELIASQTADIREAASIDPEFGDQLEANTEVPEEGEDIIEDVDDTLNDLEDDPMLDL